MIGDPTKVKKTNTQNGTISIIVNKAEKDR